MRDGLTFLDIIARQVLALRRRHDVRTPLLLMNSFRTREESLEILRRHPGLAVDDLPLDFLQTMEPKLRADDLGPVSWPEDPELEWCPPGHGDLYVALVRLGPARHPPRARVPLRVPVQCRQPRSHVRGGGPRVDGGARHPLRHRGLPAHAERPQGRPPRDPTQRRAARAARQRGRVVPGEEGYFQDTERHHWFHANNLWIDLDVLAQRLDERGGILGLPIIVNRKTVDPTRPDSTPIVQIESSMGAAVEVFEGSRALRSTAPGSAR